METNMKEALPRRSLKTKLGFKGKLFVLFAVYTVIPIIEIPFIGLSLSAPLFYFLAVESFFGRTHRRKVRLGSFTRLILLFMTGVTASLLWQGISSQGANFGQPEAVSLVRQAYWVIVFIVTAYCLAEKPEIMPILARFISWAVAALALLRWYEVLQYGKIGAWTNTVFMTQNTYGVLFSSYAPFIIAGLFDRRSQLRRESFVLSIVLVSAVIVNGSRSSWIAVVISVALFIYIFIAAFPGKAKTFFRIIFMCVFLLGAGALFLHYAPEQMSGAFQKRFATMGDLEMDKSYQFRKIMIQKGMKIFQQHPIAGCGLGRFKKTNISDLELPYVYRSIDVKVFEKKSSHNSYVQLLAETGLLGAIPFCLLLLSLLLKGFKAAIRLMRNYEFWAAGVYVSFISMSIHLWSLSGLTTTSVWLKYGMTAALVSIAFSPRKSAGSGNEAALHPPAELSIPDEGRVFPR